jgi:hypothetical protein
VPFANPSVLSGRHRVMKVRHLAGTPSLLAENDVRTIWTRDRDFRRFPRIEVRDPFA